MIFWCVVSEVFGCNVFIEESEDVFIMSIVSLPLGFVFDLVLADDVEDLERDLCRDFEDLRRLPDLVDVDDADSEPEGGGGVALEDFGRVLVFDDAVEDSDPGLEGRGLGLGEVGGGLGCPTVSDVSMSSGFLLSDMLLLLLLMLVVVGRGEMIVLLTILVSSSSKIIGTGQPSTRSSPFRLRSSCG